MARAVRRALRNGGLAVRAVADATIRSEAGEAERRSIDACFLLILLSACWLLLLLASWLVSVSLKSMPAHLPVPSVSKPQSNDNTLSKVNGCRCSAGDAVRARRSHSLRAARRQPPAAELAPAQRQPLPHAVPAGQRVWLLLYVGNPEPGDHVHAG